MRGPSLQKTTIISFTLHLTACLIVLLAVKQSNKIILPTSYTVNLVSPDVVISEHKGKDTVAIPQSSKVPAPAKIISKKKVEKAPPRLKDTNTGQESIEEKIAVLSAKKQVEKLVKLRSVITLKASDTQEKRTSETTAAPASTGKGSKFDDYYAKIMGEIKQQWIWTDTGEKDLEAVISIKILRDGTTLIKRVEKSSGNNLFDRSAVRALTKANPLPPPPHEVEIGVRFYP
jgi:TonB family protein